MTRFERCLLFKVEVSFQDSAGLSRACITAFAANLHLHKIKLLTDPRSQGHPLPALCTLSASVAVKSAKAFGPASDPPKDVGGCSQIWELSQEIRKPSVPSLSPPELQVLSLPLISTHPKGSSLGPKPAASGKRQSWRDCELPASNKSSSSTSSPSSLIQAPGPV